MLVAFLTLAFIYSTLHFLSSTTSIKMDDFVIFDIIEPAGSWIDVRKLAPTLVEDIRHGTCIWVGLGPIHIAPAVIVGDYRRRNPDRSALEAACELPNLSGTKHRNSGAECSEFPKHSTAGPFR